MRIASGQIMTQTFAGFRRLSPRVTNALVLAGAMALAPVVFSSAASAQVLGYAAAPQSAFPSDNMVAPDEPALADEGDGSVLPERLRRTVVALDTREAPGTVIIDTGNTALYYVLGQGRAFVTASASAAKALPGPACRRSPARRNGRTGIRRRR